MLNQNYIQVHKNAMGEITIRYAKPETDNSSELSPVEEMSITIDDAIVVAETLIDIAKREGNPHA